MVQPINAQLMQALDFTPEDLAANRQGTLTDAQRERLKLLMAQGARTALVVAAVVILIVVAVCVYILLGSAGIVPLPEEVFGSNALLIVGVMALVMVFYVGMLLISMSRTRRMGSGNTKITALTGKVKVSTQGMGYAPTAYAVARTAGAPTVSYVIHVGREKVYITDQAVAGAFQSGATYRVYVVGKKPGYILISAEALNAE